MRLNPTVRLSGDRNECPTCGELFNSTFAFEKHRTGTYRPPARRCLSVPEMLAAGMAKNAAGFWVTEPNPKFASRGSDAGSDFPPADG